jgi:hypothetical protein
MACTWHPTSQKGRRLEAPLPATATVSDPSLGPIKRPLQLAPSPLLPFGYTNRSIYACNALPMKLIPPPLLVIATPLPSVIIVLKLPEPPQWAPLVGNARGRSSGEPISLHYRQSMWTNPLPWSMGPWTQSTIFALRNKSRKTNRKSDFHKKAHGFL